VVAAQDYPATLLPMLMGESDGVVELLRSDDAAGVHTPAHADVAGEAEIVRAVIEVWLAANPKADTRARLEPATGGITSGPVSSQPTSTAGDPMTSTV
jgi:hypothetical protein